MKISNTIILQKDVTESYQNTEPTPAVKGKKIWLSFKNSNKLGRNNNKKKKVKNLMTKPYPQPNPGCCCSMLAR